MLSDSKVAGYNLNFSVISIVIVFPLVFAISSAFTRREQAIDAIAHIKTRLYNITFNQRVHIWNKNEKNDEAFKSKH
jgi:uncharacterized membrane protein